MAFYFICFICITDLSQTTYVLLYNERICIQSLLHFLQDQKLSSLRRARYQFPPFSPLCPDPPPVPRSRGKRGQLPERAPPDPANQISRLPPPVQCQKGNSWCPNGRHHGWKRGNQPPTPMQGLKNQGVRDKWRLLRVHKRREDLIILNLMGTWNNFKI